MWYLESSLLQVSNEVDQKESVLYIVTLVDVRRVYLLKRVIEVTILDRSFCEIC